MLAAVVLAVLAQCPGCQCKCATPANQNAQAYSWLFGGDRLTPQERKIIEDHERRMQEHARERQRVQDHNAEYYRRTGQKPVPYWDMPY